MKIFLNEYIHPLALEKLQHQVEIVSDINQIEEVDAIILRTFVVDRNIMKKAKKLKVIGKHGIGYDSIDINTAKELGIKVVYTPLANVNSVAELIVALILNSSRNVSFAHFKVRNSECKTNAPKELTGIELENKTLGLVGMGNIAQTVARILKNGFNIKVIGFDPYVSKEKSNMLGIDKYDSLEDMIAMSDIVSVSVPLTEGTKNLISYNQFKYFKSSAILVNGARGGVVNEEALFDALNEGKIRGAASDVFVKEPPTAENPLVELSNFVATPHIGAATEEAMLRMGLTVIDEVMNVLNGKEAKFVVV